mmetsp:Transcript_128250/g.256137  ORF Transcript_128250/g.256137 Transcript_128250/m.256137 type:complete len:388 (+) Transcript_128250:79-1242(+)
MAAEVVPELQPPGLRTTVVGSFPKPGYLDVADWFKIGTGGESDKATKMYNEMLDKQSKDADYREKLESDLTRATKEVIGIQTECGVSLVTDGEVRRENYIHYLCRFMDGIDFKNLTQKVCRNGAYTTELPTIRSKVTWRGPLDIAAEWRKAQDSTNAPVKYTLPGPMTIMGTTHNAFYEDEKVLAADLADIVNNLIHQLVQSGCRHVQVDEPVFARQPEKALDWGVDMLDRCFERIGSKCEKQVHICCGYPEYLDQIGYAKADPRAYFQLAPAIDKSCVDAASIEDAHCKNDLRLLDAFKRVKVILGVVQVASSRVESQEEIQERLAQALKHISPERLIVAPDCGLALLPLPILREKLMNMCAAARRCSCNEAHASGAGVKRKCPEE